MIHNSVVFRAYNDYNSGICLPHNIDNISVGIDNVTITSSLIYAVSTEHKLYDIRSRRRPEPHL